MGGAGALSQRVPGQDAVVPEGRDEVVDLRVRRTAGLHWRIVIARLQRQPSVGVRQAWRSSAASPHLSWPAPWLTSQRSVSPRPSWPLSSYTRARRVARPRTGTRRAPDVT